MGLLEKIFGTPNKSAGEKTDVRFDTYVHDGLRAMRMGELPFAERCFRAALDEREDVRTEGYLAEVLMHMQRAEDALIPLRKLCAADKQNTEAMLALAECLTQTQQFDELAETVRILDSLLPDDSRVKYAQARAAAGKGDFFTAIAMLTQAIQNTPDYEPARLERAHILLKMGQGAEALEDAEALTKNAPENEEYVTLRACALSLSGRNEEAISAYGEALSLNPFLERNILALASLYDISGQTDKAIDLLDEAIGNLPDFAEAYRMRGGIRHRLHDEQGAMDDLKKAINLRPEEIGQIDGEFSNMTNKMQNYLKQLNPYGF